VWTCAARRQWRECRPASCQQGSRALTDKTIVPHEHERALVTLRGFSVRWKVVRFERDAALLSSRPFGANSFRSIRAVSLPSSRAAASFRQPYSPSSRRVGCEPGNAPRASGSACRGRNGHQQATDRVVTDTMITVGDADLMHNRTKMRRTIWRVGPSESIDTSVDSEFVRLRRWKAAALSARLGYRGNVKRREIILAEPPPLCRFRSLTVTPDFLIGRDCIDKRGT
jgi:hypothetical protein